MANHKRRQLILAASKKIDLPLGYRSVEYIESSQNQYIDTGYIPKVNNIIVEADMAWTGSRVDSFETFVGFMYSTSTVTPRLGLHKISSKLMFGANNTSTSNITPVKDERFIYKGVFKSGDQKLYKNGTQIMSNSTTFDFASNTCPIYIFARYCPNSMNMAAMKLYRLKIYENNSLIHDYRPCIRNYDSKVGLYDLSTETFLTSANGTDFSSFGGFKRSYLPSSFQEVQYIESTGTQYIDTKFSPTSKTRVEYKVMISTSQTVASGPIIGARVGNSNPSRFFPLSYDGTTALRITYGNAQTSGIALNNSPDYTYIGVFDAKNETAKYNSTTISLVNNSFSKTQSNNLYIFGTTGYGSEHYLSKAKFYRCTIYDNDVIVRDLIPCYRKSDGEIGIYDMVTQDFYVNQGTGTFLKGPAIYKLPPEYKNVEYITTSGTQYIDTGITPKVAKTTEIQMTLARTSFNSSQGTYEGFGSNTNLNIVILASEPNKWRINGVQTDEDITNNEFVDIIMKQTSNGRYFKIKNTETTGSKNEVDNPFIIGKLGGNLDIAFNCKLRSCKIIENDVIVRNFVPCYRTTDNSVGLFDIINNVFYTNQGTGTFGKGPDLI